MKPANPAPFYACLYPALCDRAREHGYALAIHGTVATDLDLIAVPWTTAAVEAETLMLALKAQLGAFNYREMLQHECGSWATPEEIDDMVAAEHKRIDEPRGPHDCALKPHGRKAWNLYLQHGCKVDLSITPLSPP